MIPKSIAAYPDECEAVLSWLSPSSWLDQDDFDSKSREWRHNPVTKRRIHAYTGETIVLPFNGDPLIAIVQELMRHDLVEARERDGIIEYRLQRS